MTAVWVVRDKDGHFQYAYPNMMEALDAADFADTVTRENLLTPAHAAVIEAAKVAEQTLADMAHAEAIYGGQIKDDVLALIDTIVALRVQEGAK